jgi:putative transposase
LLNQEKRGEFEMARGKRQWISQDTGSYHIMSRIVGRDQLLGDEDKEKFLELLELFCSGFFVQVHSFCIMDNHFHLLLTGMEDEAATASAEELQFRYKAIFGADSLPPMGSQATGGVILPDLDEGLERLRKRLGSVSRFMQELKQTFSRWFNQKHERSGYLWGDRFKAVLISKDEAQLICSAYIDLNPVRAGIVSKPEDYRWCGLGLQARNPARIQKLLTPIDEIIAQGNCGWNWYRVFVYESGGIARTHGAKILDEVVDAAIRTHGRLGFGAQLSYRIANISEGIAFGTKGFVSKIQELANRKFNRPRSCLPGELIFATRALSTG